MSVSNLFVQKAYGQNSPLYQINPGPVKAKRVPTVNDIAPIGTQWDFVSASRIFFLASVIAGVATWLEIVGSGGGAGVFSSLTVEPGPINLLGATNINTSGTEATTIGNNAADVNIAGAVVDIGGPAGGTLDLGAGITTGTIDLGTSLTTGALVIGNHASTNSVEINSGSGGVGVTSGGLFALDFLTDVVASPTATAVINGRQCYAQFTGFTTAAAGSQVFIITNSLITANSSIIPSVNNTGTNDAQMTMTRANPGAGTVSITVTNNGAAALNGNVNITLLVLD